MQIIKQKTQNSKTPAHQLISIQKHPRRICSGSHLGVFDFELSLKDLKQAMMFFLQEGWKKNFSYQCIIHSLRMRSHASRTTYPTSRMVAMFIPSGLFPSMFFLITYCVFILFMVFFIVVDWVDMKWLKSPCKHEAQAIEVNLGNSM